MEPIYWLLKNTTIEWLEGECPDLGAALAYFTVFSLVPLVVVLMAFFGLINPHLPSRAYRIE
jgi:membrane protein